MLELCGKTLFGAGSVTGRLCHPGSLLAGARIVVVESADELDREELAGAVGVVVCSDEPVRELLCYSPALRLGGEPAIRAAASLGSVAILDARRGRLIIDPDIDAVSRCLRALRGYRT